jgi:HEAT repeat protein
MLDSDHDNQKLSRYFVQKGMSDLSPAQLIDLLTQDDPIVRSSAGFLLHLSGGNSEDFDRIAALATHADAHVREVAAYVLGQFGTPDYPFRVASVPLLSRMTRDSNDEVRVSAISALGHLRGDDAWEAILSAVADPSPDVRSVVALLLEFLDGSERSVAALRALAGDLNSDVRAAAAESLDELRDNGALTAAANSPLRGP